MKIAFLVNDVAAEKANYTTTRLMKAAVNRGHDAFVFDVGGFTYSKDDSIYAHARAPPKKRYVSTDILLRDVQNVTPQRIDLGSFDVLMLRNDPAADSHRSWAQAVGIHFGRLAQARGCIVLNNPDGLARAMNKMYLEEFPAIVRPKSIITRDRTEIRRFAADFKKGLVVKPLQGSRGQNVFLSSAKDRANLNQMVEAVSRDGYVVAQEYLPQAKKGDVRLFLMNGKPLKYKGQYAAFRRTRAPDDVRSNVHVGGETEAVEVTDGMLQIAEVVRPKLVNDGMFLVGLDIVGDKLVEINVFSPGGLGTAQTKTGVNFAAAVIKALERKNLYKTYYGSTFDPTPL